ncbi:hypothetical protein NE553_15785, partial [Eggerthella lenta]|nr:hypothetical protein [Eggerthella lenta]
AARTARYWLNVMRLASDATSVPALGRRPELARQTASGFVARFTAFNFAFLAVLYAVCAVCG